VTALIAATYQHWFERQFSAVLCKFPVAFQKYWAQQEIIGKYSRPVARRCRAPKIRTIPRSTIKFVHSVAVIGAHGLVGSSMKRSAKILAPLNAKAAATYSSMSMAEVDRRAATALNCTRFRANRI